MESRKLKRYDSAPLPTGSAAAARAVGAHASNIPRSHVALSGSSHAQAAPPPPTDFASAMAAYERQLDHYYKCMEKDNASLLKLYEVHTSDMAALRTLAKERKFKDIEYTAMEAKTASMDAFLKELMDLTSTGRGLRACNDLNSATNPSKMPTAALTPATVVSMDDVRDAVQKQQHALQEARKKEETLKLVIQALEKKVSALKPKGTPVSTRSQTHKSESKKTDDDTAEENYFLPGTAKQLRDAQRRIRELERQLVRATRDAKDAAVAIEKMKQQSVVDLQTLQRREGELAAMQNLLDSKEQLIAALETEVRNQRSTSEAPKPRPQPGAGYSRINSAPAAAGQHRSGGDMASTSLVVTHHYRLFGGQMYVDGLKFSSESFKDSFLRSVSTLLKIPYGYLTSVEVRTHSEAASIEFDVRHSACIHEDEINFLLLSHDYPELTTFLDKVKAELANRKPLDPNTVRIKELEMALSERMDEIDHLRRSMRSLEASLDRRDTDREVLNTDMDAALRETEITVKEVYEALQATQLEMGELQKALAIKSTQLRLAERAKAAAVDEAALAADKFKTELSTLREQFSASQTAAEQDQKEAVQKALLTHAEEKPELLTSAFHFDVVLPTALARGTLTSLLRDAQKARVLQLLLLCHAAQTAGAVPVVLQSCILSDSAAKLQVTVKLAFYASKRSAEAAMREIAQKVSEGTCNAALEYLRMCSDASKQNAATVAEAQRAVSEAEHRAKVAIAAMQTKTQRIQDMEGAAEAAQLRDIRAQLSSVLPGSSCDASSVVERIGELVLRVTDAESTARHHEEESRRATRQLTDAQQEREQLQQTLSDMTARCTELRVAKEQLSARVSRAENELRDQQTRAVKSEGVLVAKMKRLEADLRAKTEAADADRNRMLDEHKTAAARLAVVEEALAIKETELAELQSKTASSGPGAASSGSAGEVALREALRLAQQERTALARQVREMDTDMNDLSNIQAAMQRELEVAKQELRAKKHDFDLLVKQLIRMEEREKKWTSEQPPSPVSPRMQDNGAELDDVARESLVVLTNSNTTLQQCLRHLQSAVASTGGVSGSSLSNAVDCADAVSGAVAGRGAERERERLGDDNTGARRSGHRKSALGATVSRAATEHQKLSAQLTELLLPVLEKLKKSTSSENTKSGSNDIVAAAALGATTQRRVVKHPPSTALFSRKVSAPAVIGAELSDRTSNGSFAFAQEAAAASHGNTPKRGMASDAALSAMNTGSGGKAIVDAPPRLEFHRQSSARTYIRSNTVTSAPVYTADAGLPPAGAAATATAAGSSASPSADVKSSEAALKGSDRDAAGAAGRSPTGASAASVPHTIRRNAAQMLSTKPNLSRRTARSASGLPVGNSFVRTSANRRLPTVATVPTESSSSSTPLTKRTR